MAERPKCPHTDSHFEDKDPATLLDIGRPAKLQFQEFAHPWLTRAQRSSESENWFEALIYLWVAFNAWLGLAVTDRDYSERDWYLWRCAALHPTFHQKLAESIASSRRLRETAHRFHSLSPIFKARALADEGIPPWGEWGVDEPRGEYRRRAFSRGLRNTDYSPSCFLDHQEDPNDLSALDPERIPNDWEHTLAGIYMVRCNLFHGGKSFLSSKDKDFVSMSFTILSSVWWGSIGDA